MEFNDESIKIVLNKLTERREEIQTKLQTKKDNIPEISNLEEYVRTIELSAQSREISHCINLIKNYCK
ncbi:hypothetical protein KK120_08645 [Virgibacillus dakarensis]|nr:hypothetical protein [Virgibacillus dakarensis]MBT2215889.1 hypothetical protein [Virgibacillus dakarensis]